MTTGGEYQDCDGGDRRADEARREEEQKLPDH